MRDYIQFKFNSIYGNEVLLKVKGKANKFMFTDTIKLGDKVQETSCEIYCKDISVTENINYLKKILLLFFQETIPKVMIEHHSEFILEIILYIFDLLEQRRSNREDYSTIFFEFGLKFPKLIDLDFIEEKCAGLNKAKKGKLIWEHVIIPKNADNENKKSSYLLLQIQLT